MNDKIVLGDCLEVMRDLPDDCVDSIVCDPPAGIAFMGKAWDSDKGGRLQWVAWMESVAAECLRVMKPGGHALVWALPRTSHWTGWAWESAGWEPRDKIVHLFGSGFPKNLDIGKALDKAAGAVRVQGPVDPARAGRLVNQTGDYSTDAGWSAGNRKVTIDPPATDAAKQWEGWGTALKPAGEDWWLFRKPLVGTVAANVLAHGTGGINIDACRIGRADGDRTEYGVDGDERPSISTSLGDKARVAYEPASGGRWPANVVLDEEAAALLDSQTGYMRDGVAVQRNGGGQNIGGVERRTGSSNKNALGAREDVGYGGGGARFFYCAKASRSERTHGGAVENKHPTVKPVSLMRYLVRLITPPGGSLLDLFCGSGSTLVAADLEGFDYLGIENDPESHRTSCDRVAHAEMLRKKTDPKTPQAAEDIEGLE